MRRVTRGELDVLLAHTPSGIVAVPDRCPHMSAPLSIGALEGCVVACPLHEGLFDLCSGDPVRMPTTGGLDADGVYHPTWSSAGLPPKTDPPGLKAEARRLTRVGRFRYFPIRVVDGRIEARIPRLTHLRGRRWPLDRSDPRPSAGRPRRGSARGRVTRTRARSRRPRPGRP